LRERSITRRSLRNAVEGEKRHAEVAVERGGFTEQDQRSQRIRV
jgi:hypothetical protein